VIAVGAQRFVDVGKLTKHGGKSPVRLSSEQQTNWPASLVEDGQG